MTKGSPVFFAAVAFLFVSASAYGRQHLSGHLPPEIAERPILGAVPAAQALRLVIGLPARNQAGLDSFLRNVYNPASPDYHHFLSPDEFLDRFGPSAGDYQAVAAFAKSNHLTITAIHHDRRLLEARGSAVDVERVFHVGLVRRQRSDGSEFYSTDAEPSVDLDVPLQYVSGLDNFSRIRPALRLAGPHLGGPGGAAPGVSGTGPGGDYMGDDIRDAYCNGVSAALDGSGQSIGLLEFDTFYPSDIASYEQNADPALPANTAIAVPLDGDTASTKPGTDNVEVALDIEMAVSMAPGSTVYVYEGPNTPAAADILLDAMANNTPLCGQLSASWTGYGDGNTSAILEQFAAQGQSFFSAAGDDGAYGSK
ncbi:MAG: S53 family peptidase, partial [bacterium]